MGFVNRFLLIAGLAFANIVLLAQTQRPANGGTIQGVVQSGGTALPGVSVVATNTSTNEKFTTSTDPNGQYQLKLAVGSYQIETNMAAFAGATKQAEVREGAAPARLDVCHRHVKACRCRSRVRRRPGQLSPCLSAPCSPQRTSSRSIVRSRHSRRSPRE